MSSYLFTTSFWSQQLIVSLQGYITMQLTLILTLIMPPCTPLFVRKLSPTVSFSAYGASAVTRQILKIIAKKCFFPRRRGYSQRIISQAGDRVMATSVQRSFQSHTGTRYHPSGIDTPPYQRAGQENHHKKPALGTSDRETAAIFQPAPTRLPCQERPW